MSKHTKGPWESFNHYVWTTDKQNIANCKNVQDGNPMTPQESYANARLIAAAPELLAELKAIVEQLDVWFDLGDAAAEPPNTQDAKQLIAKATA